MTSSPIFIVGAQGSGTTFVRRILSSHPRIAIAQEFGLFVFLVTKFGTRAYNVNGQKEIVESIVRHPRFHRLGMKSDILYGMCNDDRRRSASDIYAMILGRWAALQQKSIWGEKFPEYAQYISELMRAFPDARIIHIIRDGRASTHSQRRRWGAPVIINALTWYVAVRKARKDGAKLPSSRYIEVRYEDLVRNPERVFRRICDFLGEVYDSGMLDVDSSRVSLYDSGKGAYSHRVCAWKNELSDQDIARIERLVSPLLLDMGYVLQTKPRFSVGAFLIRLFVTCLFVYSSARLRYRTWMMLYRIRHVWQRNAV